jgi:hypothetical protein
MIPYITWKNQVYCILFYVTIFLKSRQFNRQFTIKKTPLFTNNGVLIYLCK